MRALRIIRVYCRLGILREMEYRGNFVIQVMQSLAGLGTGLAGLAVVLSHTHRLGDWSPAELLAVLGIFQLVGGLIGTVIQPSMQRFLEDVRLGALDFTLVKPVDAQLVVSVQQVQVWKLVDVAMGASVLVYALWRLRINIGPGEAVMFVLALLAGGAIIYSFWLMLATSAFWFVRVENILVIFQSMYEAGRWPVGIYPPWLRVSLTFIVPVAFAITVPAEAIVGRLSVNGLAGAWLLALVMLVISRAFWRVGIRHYSGASA
jgi:ABC-2 type transport system permease protein